MEESSQKYLEEVAAKILESHTRSEFGFAENNVFSHHFSIGQKYFGGKRLKSCS